MWLGQVPWAGRHWALPVLTVLAPSTRYYQQQGRRHKKLTDLGAADGHAVASLAAPAPPGPGGRQQLCRAGSAHCCQSLRQPVALIARLRLDAALYAPAPARQPGQNGRPALKGPRRPPLKTLLDNANVTWANSEVAWYDGTTRTVELSSQTAVCTAPASRPSPFAGC